MMKKIVAMAFNHGNMECDFLIARSIPYLFKPNLVFFLQRTAFIATVYASHIFWDTRMF